MGLVSDRDPTDPVTVMAELDEATTELNDRSNELAQVERSLEPVEVQVEEFRASHEEGLWIKYVENGEKFPPEKLRERLANRSMDAELLGRYTGLVNRRKRLEKRITTLKSVVNAKQSILSAMKEAARVDGSGMGRR